MVKSIQYGSARFELSVVTQSDGRKAIYAESVAINIKTVDPTKCMVLLDGVAIMGDTRKSISLPRLSNLTSDTLYLTSSSIKLTDEEDYLYSLVSWQVIEFY